LNRIEITPDLSFSRIVYGMWRLSDDTDTSTAHVQAKIEDQQNQYDDRERSVALVLSLESGDLANISEHVDHLQDESSQKVDPDSVFAELVLSCIPHPVVTFL